ncbi:MAG: 2Fe-2S iron-sulfur cluster-binding protein [Flavobacteriales bacterium]
MWKKAIIQTNKRLTKNATELTIRLKRGHIQAAAGQFIVLEIIRAGREMRASFSISELGEDHWKIAVKVARKGGVSEWLNTLSGPTEVRLAGPFGQFALQDLSHRHVFVAGGSGISPIMCMIREIIRQNRVPVLVFGNESEEDAMYLDQLREWRDCGKLELVEIYNRDFQAALKPEIIALSHLYICGPVEMNRFIVRLVEQSEAPLLSTQLEHYGQPKSSGVAGTVLWEPRIGKPKRIDVENGESILDAAQRHGVSVDSACMVGVCGSCKMKLSAGRLICNSDVVGAGTDVTLCTAYVAENQLAIVQANAGINRTELLVAALILGLVFIGLLNVPPGLGLSSHGPMNVGHENLSCQSCHVEAPGSMRQQLGHNFRKILSMHDEDWVAMGYAEVGNAQCQSCHQRPNDRHPVSRFEELRFASQRASLGPHRCVNCHGEHQGVRIGNVESGFCSECHSDLAVKNDPIKPLHVTLVDSGEWDTCLRCHDFHGNHIREVPIELSNGLRAYEIQKYFKGGADPYGDSKMHQAKTETEVD